jgi:hypothetical protein
LGLGNAGGLAVSPRLSPVEYEQLIGAIREVVHRVVPPNATMLVVSRGDDELVRLGRRQALHFPLDEEGRYAGYHPGDSEAAIAMVEQMRERGAEYFLLPATGFWWLEFYDQFRKYLETKYQVVNASEHCWIVQLTEGTRVDADTSFMADAPRRPDPTNPLDELIQALLPENARIAVLVAGEATGNAINGHDTWLMPREPAGRSAVMQSLGSLEHSGIQFIVIPSSAFDWMEDHPEVTKRLHSHHRFVTRQQHLCEIYELDAPPGGRTQQRRVESHAENGSARGRDQGRRSFGEMLRGILFPSRRNVSRS